MHDRVLTVCTFPMNEKMQRVLTAYISLENAVHSTYWVNFSGEGENAVQSIY